MDTGHVRDTGSALQNRGQLNPARNRELKSQSSLEPASEDQQEGEFRTSAQPLSQESSDLMTPKPPPFALSPLPSTLPLQVPPLSRLSVSPCPQVLSAWRSLLRVEFLQTVPHGGLAGPGALALLQKAGYVLHDGENTKNYGTTEKSAPRKGQPEVLTHFRRRAGQAGSADCGPGRPQVVRVTAPRCPRLGRVSGGKASEPQFLPASGDDDSTFPVVSFEGRV